MRTMDHLRAEHRALRRGLSWLDRVAGEAAGAPLDVLRPDVARAVTFLEHQLLPYAAAEDEVIHPVVERTLAAEGVAAATRCDGVELRRLVRELAATQSTFEGDARPLRSCVTRLLDTLETLVTVHFANEERIYFPLLERRLSPFELETLLEQLERSLEWHRSGAA